MFKQLQAHAPCYASLKDDGAKQKCTCCNKYYNVEEVYYCFVPNQALNTINCKNCIDDEWKQSAKDFSHIKL